MRRIRASAGDVLAGLRFPQPREAPYDVLSADLGHEADAMTEVEQRLAELAGVALPSPDSGNDAAATTGSLPAAPSPEFARRLLHVAELVTFGAFVLLVVSALLAARFGTDTLRVHELPFAGWGLVATLSALALARLGGHTYDATAVSRQRLVSGVLLVVLLSAVTGVVASADGVAGPAWVLFLPVVLVAGAVGGPAVGLLVGAGAAAGVYSAAGLSHTLTVAGIGRMVVLLPAFPAVGWSAGALSRLARDAAAEAHARRVALEEDVNRLTDVLERVAEGDLTVFPSAGGDTDPAMTKMAVAFADSLLALRRLVRQMDSVADQLASNAVDLAGSAGQEAAAVGQQVAAVAETTTTIEELAATAASIADTAVRVAQFAGHTRGDVDGGIQAVELSNEAMERIADRVRELDSRADRLAERIGTIAESTHLIDELARRTTILAVNASIEAARAAEHGRGFANVAQEVGELANRAREATARIDGIVGQLQAESAATAAAAREGDEAVLAGVARQDDVVVALSRIAAMVDRTTVAAREITEATRQQRFASDAVVAAMATVTGASDHYRDGSRRHATAAERLRDLAETLRAELRRFKVS